MDGVPTDVGEEVGWAVEGLAGRRASIFGRRRVDVNVSMEVVG